jgi:hypothetical protein
MYLTVERISRLSLVSGVLFAALCAKPLPAPPRIARLEEVLGIRGFFLLLGYFFLLSSYHLSFRVQIRFLSFYELVAHNVGVCAEYIVNNSSPDLASAVCVLDYLSEVSFCPKGSHGESD